jgi:hypothetical protein
LASIIGEVAFFELPCEPAQAAVVEILTSTSSCSAIVVVDVSKGTVNASHEVGYWLSFFSCSHKSEIPLQVTVVGSHVDMLAPTVDAQEMLRHICSEVSQSFYNGNVMITGSIALQLTSATLDTLNHHLEEMIALASRDSHGIMFNGARHLLRLLQMQLKGKSMCQLSEVSELVAAKRFYPEGDPTKHLLVYLRELDTQGFLHIVDDKDNSLLILNIASVLHTLSAQVEERASVGPSTTLHGKGIITEESLRTIFPDILVTSLAKYLTQLQLCLQVVNPGHLHVISSELPQSAVQQLGVNSPIIFFPSFIHAENVHCRKWMKPNQVFFQGFVVKVVGKHEYLPLRFFHLLLLNVAFPVAFPSSSTKSQLDIQRCTLWKSGIQWLVANGIEVFIELAKDQKRMVVAGRSAGDDERECVSMLSAVMEEILEAKSEFMNLDVFLISPGELQEDIVPKNDAMQLFDMTEVQNALTRSYESILSTDCSRVLQLSHFSLLRTYTFWNLLFPLEARVVLSYLEAVVSRWRDIGKELGISLMVLGRIEQNHAVDAIRCAQSMVCEWLLKCPQLRPCWYCLVKALESLGLDRVAETILNAADYGIQVRVQKYLLESPNSDIRFPFLQSFAALVKSRWTLFSPHLRLHPREERRGRGGKKEILPLLEEWKERTQATYGDLLDFPYLLPLPTVYPECLKLIADMHLLNVGYF